MQSPGFAIWFVLWPLVVALANAEAISRENADLLISPCKRRRHFHPNEWHFNGYDTAWIGKPW